jgi:hypothetical protein
VELDAAKYPEIFRFAQNDVSERKLVKFRLSNFCFVPLFI